MCLTFCLSWKLVVLPSPWSLISSLLLFLLGSDGHSDANTSKLSKVSKRLKLIISVRSRRLTAMGEDTEQQLFFKYLVICIRNLCHCLFIWVGKHLCLPFYSASTKTIVWWSEVLAHAYIYFSWRTR